MKKRPSKGSGRVLDAVVIALAVPTVAIAATMGWREYDVAHERAVEVYRAALARCDESGGAARAACRSDAKAALRSAASGPGAEDEAAQQTAVVADALARAQCDVLTGYSTDACAGTESAERAPPHAQPVAVVAGHAGLDAATSPPAR